MANNPVNWTDPTGKKVFYCTKAFHVYIAINGGKINGSWGFYPVNDPYAGIASGILNGWVPGYIKMNETGGECDPVTIDDCHDQKAYDAIHTLFRAQPYYHLLYFNCRDWAKTVLRMSGID